MFHKILQSLWDSPFWSFFRKNNNHCSSCTSFLKKCTFSTHCDFTLDRMSLDLRVFTNSDKSSWRKYILRLRYSDSIYSLIPLPTPFKGLCPTKCRTVFCRVCPVISWLLYLEQMVAIGTNSSVRWFLNCKT